ncbi:MAG TPA: hypothetical protein VLA56_17090 [Pseudomonadales bacterium]|nr:hypothetical protein [Pseudomonadales bacterium]
MATLVHRLVYEAPAAEAALLPLGDELGPLGGDAPFTLVEDPRHTDRTSIVGMFVLRPAREAWTTPMLAAGRPDSLFGVRDWCFNVRGEDGGVLISDGNPLDAYRLALQYGLADAVIVGSNTVATEGVDREGAPGYLWQPYGPTAWPRLMDLDPQLEAKIARVRERWQALGVLSARRWPAQIVVSASGERRAGAADLLAARIFSARHPDGSPVEALILTSVDGAARLRARAADHGLGDRIDDLLVVLSPPHAPAELDLAVLPQHLRARFDMRVANHDGGRRVLSAFSAAGILPQLNLTLMRERSVLDVLAARGGVGAATEAAVAREFEARRQLFFSADHRLPPALRPLAMLADDGEAVVVTFDARALRGL